MTEEYNYELDIIQHKERVSRWISVFINILSKRSIAHDNSKLYGEERKVFKEYSPKLNIVTFGSEEYNKILEEMKVGINFHYKNNKHHPEHFDNGIGGMSLIDLIEMVSDWLARSDVEGKPVNIEYLSKRFNIDGQLLDVIKNTLNGFIFDAKE